MVTPQSIETGVIPNIGKKQRLDAALSAALPEISRERIKSLITEGQLLIGGAVCTDPASKNALACRLY